jgi:sodium transport system permease protein
MSMPTVTESHPRWGFAQSAARVGRLARKELSEILRDRRTVITLVLMPLLLYPLLSFAFQQFLPTLLTPSDIDRDLIIAVPNGHKQVIEALLLEARKPALSQAVFVAGTTGPSGAPSPLLAAFDVFASDLIIERAHDPRLDLAPQLRFGRPGIQSPLVVRFVETRDLETSSTNDDIDLTVELSPLPRRWNTRDWNPADWVPVDLRLTYMDHSARARMAVDFLEKHINLANARILHQGLNARGQHMTAVPVRIVRMFIAPDDASTSPPLSLTAVVPLILILMTITGAVYPAIDLTAGERERGTLEILVSAPVPRMSLLLAKYIAVLTVAVLTATINLAMMMITLHYNQLTSLVFRNDISVALVVQLFFLLLLFAAFFSAVLLTLTSFARSFKEAQAYLIPLMLASLAPGVMAMIPGLHLEGPLSVTPLVNIVLLARDLAEGHERWGVTIVVVLSTSIYAVAAIAAAARIFGAEAVLYSDQAGWSDLFRRPAEPQPTATVAGALFCLALAFPAFFLVLGLLPHIPAQFHLGFQVFATALLFVGFPLLGCLLARIRPTTALQIRWPPLASWPAALLLAAACVPVIYQLFAWMYAGGWTLLTEEQESRIRGMLRSWRVISPVALAVSFAAMGAVEELFFRGYLFSALRARAGQRMTIVVSAVLFGLFHFVTQFDRLVPSTLMGLVLGWLCWQTHSVLPGMLLHATYNATYLLLAYYQRQPRFSGNIQLVQDIPLWWQAAAVPVGLAAAALVYWCRVRSEVSRQWSVVSGQKEEKVLQLGE